MTAGDFLPPAAPSPDLFLLDARFAHFGFPSLRPSRTHSRGPAVYRRNKNNPQHHPPHHLNPPNHRATLPFDAYPPSYGEAEGRDEGIEWKSQPCLLQRKLDVLAAAGRRDDSSGDGAASDNNNNGDDDNNIYTFRSVHSGRDVPNSDSLIP